MTILSFIRSDFGLRPVQVEVVLLPGVSQLQILGLPDQTIRESSKRILSALRYQGFSVPAGQQVLVNLEPNGLKKSSQGLDLAIALGILCESGQVGKECFHFSQDYFYGSLGLKGEVVVPEDLYLLQFEKFNKRLVTGIASQPWHFATAQIPSLSAVKEPQWVEPSLRSLDCEAHGFDPHLTFDFKLARLMEVCGVGEHPLLIAGAAGCGKTTLVENLARLLPISNEDQFREAQKYWWMSGRTLKKRPIVQPHHSATPVAMIGGGSSLRFGEISMAHSGVLVLDELLEFHPSVQSALREPMEKGTIYITRNGRRQTFPAQSLILATTNLCPCGQYRPQDQYGCRCSSLKLRQYLERLSGPFLDRFTLFYIVRTPALETPVTLGQIQTRIFTAQNFARSERGQKVVNQRLDSITLLGQLHGRISAQSIPFSKSHRRRLSLLRVARSLADLDACPQIQQSHLEEAQELTAGDIHRLEHSRLHDFAMR